MSRAVIMARGHLIEPADLDLQAADLEPAGSVRQARGRIERETLVDVLSRHCGNISEAARSLEVSRPTLHGLLDKHNIDASTLSLTCFIARTSRRPTAFSDRANCATAWMSPRQGVACLRRPDPRQRRPGEVRTSGRPSC